MTDPNPPGQSRSASQRSVGFQVLVWLAIALASLSAFFLLFGWAQAGSLWPWGKKGAPDVLVVVRSAATCVTVLGGTVIASIAIRQQRSRETSVQIAEKAQTVTAEAARITAKTVQLQGKSYRLDLRRYDNEQASDLRARFVTAAQQIGDERSASVRIAGLYAMGALARDWSSRGDTQDMQSCLDVVCAYLRIPIPIESGATPSIHAEAHVRHAAQRVLTDFFRPEHELPTGVLEVDLTGAMLVNFDARGAHFRGRRIWLNHATFSGHATWFNDAAFSAGRSSFFGCVFQTPRVDFTLCQFAGEGDKGDPRAGTDFASVQFLGDAVNFGDSQFCGSVRWVDNNTYVDDLPEQLIRLGARRSA